MTKSEFLSLLSRVEFLEKTAMQQVDNNLRLINEMERMIDVIFRLHPEVIKKDEPKDKAPKPSEIIN